MSCQFQYAANPEPRRYPRRTLQCIVLGAALVFSALFAAGAVIDSDHCAGSVIHEE
jgi:hypothetical protein